MNIREQQANKPKAVCQAGNEPPLAAVLHTGHFFFWDHQGPLSSASQFRRTARKHTPYILRKRMPDRRCICDHSSTQVVVLLLLTSSAPVLWFGRRHRWRCCYVQIRTPRSSDGRRVQSHAVPPDLWAKNKKQLGYFKDHDAVPCRAKSARSKTT